MKKVSLYLSVLLLSLGSGYAQNMITTKSAVSFFSDALLEDISAQTTETKGILNTVTGEFVFKIPIQSFQFANDLMKEHFNENYMESEKYPNAVFKGEIDLSTLPKKGAVKDLTLDAEGKLSIHGVELESVIPVKLTGDRDQLIVSSVFTAALEDFNITIPTIVFQKIAEQVEVNVLITLEPLKSK